MVPFPNLKVIQTLLTLKLRSMFQSSQHDSVIPKIKEQLRVHCFPMDGIDSLSLDPFIHQGGGGGGERRER